MTQREHRGEAHRRTTVDAHVAVHDHLGRRRLERLERLLDTLVEPGVGLTATVVVDAGPRVAHVRCVHAHEAMRLAGVFLQAVIDECGDAPGVEQLRLLEAV